MPKLVSQMFVIAVLHLLLGSSPLANGPLIVEANQAPIEGRGEHLVILRNTGGEAAGISEILSGAVKVWPNADPVLLEEHKIIWCRCWPDRIGGGAQSAIRICFEEWAPIEDPLTVRYRVGQREQRLEIRLERDSSSFQLSQIRFSEDGGLLWAGVKNRGTDENRICGIQINGKERIHDIVGSPALPAGKTVVVGIPLGGDYEYGKDVFIIVRAGENETCAAHVRVNDGFTLGADVLTDVPAVRKRLLLCVTHARPTYQETALVMEHAYREMRESCRHTIGNVYACHSSWHDGLSIFPALVDCVWASTPRLSPPRQKDESRGVVTMEAFAEWAYGHTGPSPWVAVMPVLPLEWFGPSCRLGLPGKRISGRRHTRIEGPGA